MGKRDYWLDGSLFWGTVSGGIWQSCAFKEHWDFWRAEDDPLGSNLNAYYPRASFDGDKNQYVQTRYLQDASYIRLKNIQVGYTFPKSITQSSAWNICASMYPPTTSGHTQTLWHFRP